MYFPPLIDTVQNASNPCYEGEARCKGRNRSYRELVHRNPRKENNGAVSDGHQTSQQGKEKRSNNVLLATRQR